MAQVLRTEAVVTFYISYRQHDSDQFQHITHNIKTNVDVYVVLMYMLNCSDPTRFAALIGKKFKIDLSYQDAKCVARFVEPIQTLTDVEAKLINVLSEISHYKETNITLEKFVVEDGNQFVTALRQSEIWQKKMVFAESFVDEISQKDIVVVAWETRHEHIVSKVLKTCSEMRSLRDSKAVNMLRRDLLLINLMKIKVLDNIQRQYSDVTFKIECIGGSNDCTITIEGKHGNVKKAKEVLEKFETEIKMDTIKPVYQTEIFLRPDVADTINKELGKKNVACCWRVEDSHSGPMFGSLKICCMEADIEDASRVISTTVTEEDMDLEGDIKELVNSKSWEKVTNQIEMNFEGAVMIRHNGRDAVIITGISKDVPKAKAELLKIANEGIEYDDEDPENEEGFEYVVQNYDDFAYLIEIKMDVLYGLASSLNLKLEQFEEDNRQGFIIDGCPENVHTMIERLEAFVMCISCDHIDVESRYFASGSGHKFLEQVEKDCEVLLNQMALAEQPFTSKTSYSQIWPMGNGNQVHVKVARLEESGADVIAAAFETSRGTPDFKKQKKCDMIEVQFPIPKLVDQKASSQKLSSRLSSLFEQLNEEQYKSVAIRLRDVKSWPMETFIRIIVERLQQLSGKLSGFTVMLCDTKTETVQMCMSWLADNLSSGELSVTPQMEGTDDKRIAKIRVVSGSLDKAEVDVIVCTVSGDLDLRRGFASRALLETAGHGIQDELDEQFQDCKLPRGVIAQTRGHNLPCKRVLFGALDPYDERTTNSFETFVRMNINTFVRDCLDLAEEHSATSIAFPAIGSGKLRYPLDIVAEQMFATVDWFLLDNPNSGINLVQFIIYHESVDALTVFQQQQQIYEDSNKKSHKAREEGPPRHYRVKIIGMEENVEKAKQHIEDRVNIIQAKSANGNSSVYQKAGSDEASLGNPGTSFGASTTAGIRRKSDFNSAQGDTQSLASGSQKSEKQQTANLPANMSMYGSQQKAAAGSSNTQASNSVSSKAGKQSPDVVEDVIELDGEDALELLKFYQRFDPIEKYKGKACEISVGANMLHVKGKKGVVKSLKNDLASARKKLGDLQRESLPVEGNIEKVLAKLSDIRNSKVCCVFKEQDKEVVFYAKLYEDAQAAMHQLKVALGQTAVTNRASRDLDTSANLRQVMANMDLGSQSPAATDTRSSSHQDFSHSQRGARPKTYQHLKPDAKNLQTYETNEKILVYVYTADILKLRAECIVNAANADLQHGGGIARVISKAAGRKLDQEGYVYIKKNGFLAAGEVCTTTAGELPYRCVIHAVGPCWSDYTPHTKGLVDQVEDDLFNAIYNSFIEADKWRLRSIAVPAVSSAIYGCPKELCAVQYARAILEYSRGRSTSQHSLEEVHFIDKDFKMVQLIQDTFSYMIPRGRDPPTYDKNAYVKKSKGGGGTAGSKLPDPSPSPRVATDIAPSSATSSAGGAFPFITTDPITGVGFKCKLSTGHSLLIYSGDLFKLAGIQMVACSDSVTGKKVGGVNEQLALKGGAGYEKQKKVQMDKNPPKAGDVLISGAGNNNFSYVAHVYLYQKLDLKGSGDKKRKKMEMFLKLFEGCKQKHCKTLALPLLGTGKGSANPDEYLSVLFEGLLAFCRRNPNYDLTVHLVNIDDWKTKKAIDIVTPIIGALRQSPSAAGSNPGQSQGAHKAQKPDSKQGQPYNRGGGGRGGQVNGRGDGRGGGRGRGSTPAYSDGSGRGAKGRAGSGQQPVGSKSIMSRRPGPPHSRADGGKGTNSSQTPQSPTGISATSVSGSDPCTICMEVKMKRPKQLHCGHTFCTACIDQSLQYKQACPICGAVCGIITGDQPHGDMEVKVYRHRDCAGYKGCGSIEITYSFPDGKQGADHPQPGKPYRGITRTAYLPNNTKGRQITEMLKVAFHRKLVFTIGSSRTTGQEGVITWNDIHHKTNPKPYAEFGYPDPDYLDRVTDELAAKGVTEKDIRM